MFTAGLHWKNKLDAANAANAARTIHTKNLSPYITKHINEPFYGSGSLIYKDDLNMKKINDHFHLFHLNMLKHFRNKNDPRRDFTFSYLKKILKGKEEKDESLSKIIIADWGKFLFKNYYTKKEIDELKNRINLMKKLTDAEKKKRQLILTKLFKTEDEMKKILDLFFDWITTSVLKINQEKQLQKTIKHYRKGSKSNAENHASSTHHDLTTSPNFSLQETKSPNFSTLRTKSPNFSTLRTKSPNTGGKRKSRKFKKHYMWNTKGKRYLAKTYKQHIRGSKLGHTHKKIKTRRKTKRKRRKRR